MEAYKLISDQIASVLSGQPEKEKTKALLNKLMVDFFCFDPAQTTPDSQEESNEGFSEEDVRAAMADCFIGKRLEHGEQSLAESWARLREEVMAIEAKSGEDNKAAESKKAKPTRPQKNTRGGHTKKADKKGEGNGKGVTMFERGLARAGIREFGEPMELLQQKGKRMEDALFLPIANSERCSVMYGTANFYSFFRHFHCLYERLIKARNFAGKGFDGDLEKKPELAARFASVLGRRVDEFKAERYEQIFTKGLYAYLKGTIDTARYEDFCRHTLGPQAYLLFTMDKLINSVPSLPTLGVDSEDRAEQAAGRRGLQQGDGPLQSAKATEAPRDHLLHILQPTDHVSDSSRSGIETSRQEARRTRSGPSTIRWPRCCPSTTAHPPTPISTTSVSSSSIAMWM